MTRICVVYPDLLGTYGDAGNALVLRERLIRRGRAVEMVNVTAGDDVPSADIYLLGGGEDGPQRLAVELLRTTSFCELVRDGAFVVAVCAGLQILGRSFCVEGDDEFEGLGLVDVVTRRGVARSVGELAVDVEGRWLVGFENHGGVTTRNGDVSQLGTVARGRGNGDGHDGFRTDRMWATYAHGPVLAMNPWFADSILERVVGEELEPLATVADQLYDSRCAALGL